MSKPMTDAGLAELRNILERGADFHGEILGDHIDAGRGITPICSIDIDDVRALVARLNAAETLIEELREQISEDAP